MPGPDADESFVAARLAIAIAAADVSATTLVTDLATSFPEAQLEAAPCLCYDVAFQMKCVVLNYVVVCKVQQYRD